MLKPYAHYGAVQATDGMQLLVASGFTLPWQDDVLVPRARFLASLDLTDIEAVDVGKSGNYVAIRIGPWTFYLRVNAGGRFPKVMDSVPDAATAIAHCKLSADDVLFLAENLPKLPCDDEENLRVTLEMNGGVAVRAKSADTTTPTEIVLTNSCSTGSAIRVNANRSYLARAGGSGCTRFTSPARKQRCSSETIVASSFSCP